MLPVTSNKKRAIQRWLIYVTCKLRGFISIVFFLKFPRRLGCSLQITVKVMLQASQHAISTKMWPMLRKIGACLQTLWDMYLYIYTYIYASELMNMGNSVLMPMGK